MQIKNNNNQHFTAIYKIPKSNAKTQIEIDKFVAPIYNRIKHNPIYYFCGDCPYDAYIAKAIEENVKQQHLSYDWILQNAKRFNIELPDPEKIDIWVITGEKDISLVDKFTEQADKICKPTFGEKLKLFLFGKEENPELPNHLRIYSDALEKLSRLRSKFTELMADKNVTEVDSSYKLVQYLMKE